MWAGADHGQVDRPTIGGIAVPDNLEWPKNSCGLAVVVLEQPTKPFSASYWPFSLLACVGRRKQDHVVFTLMRAFFTSASGQVREREPVGIEAELDEMWGCVGDQETARWLWHAIAHAARRSAIRSKTSS
jgi:hypothetical protein